MSIAVIAGLGNPGLRYERTRHNLGFDIIDTLAVNHKVSWKTDSTFQAELAKITIGSQAITLLKPQTYMNDSGIAISAYCKYFKLLPYRLLVVHDDITLAACTPKVSIHGGAGGHNGVESIFEHLGEGFVRYRVGIGHKPDPRMDLADYVLTRFSGMELQLFESRLSRFVKDLELIVDKGAIQAMNLTNRKNNKP